MDVVSAASNIVTIPTAVKDAIESFQKAKESFEKVKKNRTQLLKLSAFLSKAKNSLEIILERQSRILYIPSHQESLQNIVHDLTSYYDRCKRLLTKHAGLGGKKKFIQAWWKANDVKDEIDNLEKSLERSYKLFEAEMASQNSYALAELIQRSKALDASYIGVEFAHRDEMLFEQLVGNNHPVLESPGYLTTQVVNRRDSFLTHRHVQTNACASDLIPEDDELLVAGKDGTNVDLQLSNSITLPSHFGWEPESAPLAVSEYMPDMSLTEARELYEQSIEILKFGEPAEALAITEGVFKHLNTATFAKTNFLADLIAEKMDFMSCQAKCLCAIGRKEDAFQKYEEMVGILHWMLKRSYEDPKTLKRYLIRTMLQMSNFLHSQNEFEKALQCALEGLEIFLEIDESNWSSDPSAPRIHIRIAFIYTDLGFHEDALIYYKYATEGFQELVQKGRDNYAMELASSLCYLARCFSRIGFSRRSSDSMRKAINIYKRILYYRPGVEKQSAISQLLDHAHTLWDSGSPEVALQCNELAVDLRRDISVDSSRDPTFALFLRGLSRCLFETGKREARDEYVARALDIIREAIAINKSLTDEQPERHKRSLAWDLAYMVTILLETKQYSGALLPAERAADIYRHIAQIDSSKESHKALVCALEQLSGVYRALGKFRDMRRIHAEIEGCKKGARVSAEARFVLALPDERVNHGAVTISSDIDGNSTTPNLRNTVLLVLTVVIIIRLLFHIFRVCFSAITIFGFKMIAFWCIFKWCISKS